MLVRNGLDGGVVEEQRGIFGLLHVELDEGLRAKRRVRGHNHALVLRELDEPFLTEVWVVFDLQSGGLDGGVAEKIHDQLTIEITDTDALGQAFLRDRLHGRPRLLNGGGAGHDVLAVVGEARGVAVRGVDVFEGDGEMDNVQVEVVDAPVVELLLADRLDAVAVVEGVPQLGDEEEVFALDEAVLDGAGDALARLHFVAVVLKKGQSAFVEQWIGSELGWRTTCTVEKAVPGLDGVVDGVGASVVGHFPETEADEWHFVAAVELDCGGRHAGVCSSEICLSKC